jgi:hypothetical protein
MEFCFEFDPMMGGSRDIVASLVSLARSSPRALARAEKAAYYRTVAQTMLALAPHWRRGIWDFSDDQAEARQMFNDYTSVLSTRKGARTAPSNAWAQAGSPMRAQGGPYFATFTFAWMLTGGASANALRRATTAIPQSYLWNRSTFVHLLGMAPMTAPSEIESDVVYTLPGRPDYALTGPDLDGEAFNYLRPMLG